MKIRAFYLAAALAAVFASTAMADLVGSTYSYSESSTNHVDISGGTTGTYTDPTNPGFCVGPPNACNNGNGLSGAFTFADTDATHATITFTFFGSTNSINGTFSIDLGSFVLPDGDKISSVTYASGSLGAGTFSSVSWNGTDAVFTGSATSGFSAIGGDSIVFDVLETPPNASAPEPASILLTGTVLVGLFTGLKKLRLG